MSEIVYRDPPPVYPENGVNVPLGDPYMRLIVVVAPTATGATYRSSDYVSKLAMRNGSGILDMFTFRGKSTLVATRYLMVFDSVAEPVAGTRPIIPCWTLAAGQWSTWEPEDGIALVNGLYVANSSSEVDYQPVADAQEVDLFARVKAQ